MKAIVKLAARVGVMGLLLGGGSVQATNFLFQVTSGDWNTPASWDQGRAPTNNGSDLAYIQNDGKATISGPASAFATFVGYDNAGNGYLEIASGADFNSGSGLLIGSSARQGSALQTGGNVSAWIFRTYGTGSYTQQAGRVSMSGQAYSCVGVSASGSEAGQTSDYVMVGGTLDQTTLNVGDDGSGVGRFIQYGGIVSNSNVATHVGYGATGYYYQYGGTHYCADLYMSWAAPEGRYVITNGDLIVGNIIHLAVYNSVQGDMQVSGSANVNCPNIWVGAGENGVGVTGNWTQAGGTVTVSTEMDVAHGDNSSGRYTLGGGTLTVGSLRVGQGVNTGPRNAIFMQTGGVLTASSIYFGVVGGTTNAYMLSQGGVSSCGNVNMGYASPVTARWDIAGGSVTINNLHMPDGAGGNKIDVNLSGGALNIANLYMGWNPGAIANFTQSGGTNTVTGDFWLGRNDATPCCTYTITGGKLVASTIQVGSPYSSIHTSTGTFHVVGVAPQVQASAYVACPADQGLSTLELTLDQNGGMRPIAISGAATLNGALTIGLTNNVKFELGTVVTVMTYSARSGAFAQTNLLNGLECNVNYLPTMITLDNLRPQLNKGTIFSLR